MISRSPFNLSAALPHWREYLIEATLVGTFLVSASAFGVLLFHPSSPVVPLAPAPLQRRILMGAAMGMTAICLIRSPLGQRSGAHMNPAVTFTYWRLGRVASQDAFYYILAQFLGATVSITVLRLAAAMWVSDPHVNYVATRPAAGHLALAWITEFCMAFVMMTTVLTVSNSPRLARFTPFFAASLVWSFIILFAPVSGMSMNPARSFGPDTATGVWGEYWIYATAPVLAMMAAAQVYVTVKGAGRVYCAKLDHFNAQPCIFKCRHSELLAAQRMLAGGASRP